MSIESGGKRVCTSHVQSVAVCTALCSCAGSGRRPAARSSASQTVKKTMKAPMNIGCAATRLSERNQSTVSVMMTTVSAE